MSDRIAASLVDIVVSAARESGRDVADIPLDEIAARAGMSRATLYRRIGSRRALDEAVRATGVDPGERPGVRERAIRAAAELVIEAGLGALTLDAVAARARCSVPALHSQLGGREGLLAALFERFGPLVPAERLLATPPASFREGVRAIYGILFDAVNAEPRLLGALVADALARPDEASAALFRDRILPRVLGSVGRWLAGEIAAGRCRPLPPPILIQFLGAPIAAHVATRGLIARLQPGTLPAREETLDLFTEMYCRAVALPAPDAAAPDAARAEQEVS